MVSIGDAGEEKDKSRGCVIFPLLATSSTQRRRSQASTKKKKKKAHKGQHLGDRLRKQVRLEALLFGVCDPCPLFSPLFSRLMYIIYISIGSTVIIIVKYRVFCRAGLGFPLS